MLSRGVRGMKYTELVAIRGIVVRNTRLPAFTSSLHYALAVIEHIYMCGTGLCTVLLEV